MVKIKTEFKDIDKGLKKITKDLDQASRKFIKVGILAGATTDDGEDLVSIALQNEFGVDGVQPARPFMRQTFEKFNEDTTKIIANQLNQIYTGTKNIDKAMGEVGLWYEGRVKFTITNGEFASLSPVTVAAKGSTKPLIDSGNMRSSIRYEVVG